MFSSARREASQNSRRDKFARVDFLLISGGNQQAHWKLPVQPDASQMLAVSAGQFRFRSGSRFTARLSSVNLKPAGRPVGLGRALVSSWPE